MCRCMPPEIVRPQFDPGQFSCLSDNDPGGSILDGENPLTWIKHSLFDVRPQTLYRLSNDEDDLIDFAACLALGCIIPSRQISSSISDISPLCVSPRRTPLAFSICRSFYVVRCPGPQVQLIGRQQQLSMH
jgi:hypothetical protein